MQTVEQHGREVIREVLEGVGVAGEHRRAVRERVDLRVILLHERVRVFVADGAGVDVRVDVRRLLQDDPGEVRERRRLHARDDVRHIRLVGRGGDLIRDAGLVRAEHDRDVRL